MAHFFTLDNFSIYSFPEFGIYIKKNIIPLHDLKPHLCLRYFLSRAETLGPLWKHRPDLFYNVGPDQDYQSQSWRRSWRLQQAHDNLLHQLWEGRRCHPYNLTFPRGIRINAALLWTGIFCSLKPQSKKGYYMSNFITKKCLPLKLPIVNGKTLDFCPLLYYQS